MVSTSLPRNEFGQFQDTFIPEIRSGVYTGSRFLRNHAFSLRPPLEHFWSLFRLPQESPGLPDEHNSSVCGPLLGITRDYSGPRVLVGACARLPEATLNHILRLRGPLPGLPGGPPNHIRSSWRPV